MMKVGDIDFDDNQLKICEQVQFELLQLPRLFVQ